MSSSWPFRNRLRLVASISILAGATILVVVTEWGSLAGNRDTPSETIPAPPAPAASDAGAPSAATNSPASGGSTVAASETPGITGGPTPVRAFGAPPIPPPQPEGARSPLADRLGDPQRSISDDIATVDEIVATYLGVFRQLPIGTNAEITAALAGDNARGLAPLPADHPAISPGGELLDRWGTPFFFHQVTREFLEVRSAGPDRRLFSADDIVSAPRATTAPPSLTARAD